MVKKVGGLKFGYIEEMTTRIVCDAIKISGVRPTPSKLKVSSYKQSNKPSQSHVVYSGDNQLELGGGGEK